ncbi:hypothetical protein F4775DRAFT_509151 [Biscogniauxia sp. FL1348]|nr:hypothetical protein F4775DRAFT_509151 [Biscogniauxia sp. FL1348]
MPTSSTPSGRDTPTRRADWHEVVLRQKYNDPRKLKESLDTMYGQGGYQVKIKANRHKLFTNVMSRRFPSLFYRRNYKDQIYIILSALILPNSFCCLNVLSSQRGHEQGTTVSFSSSLMLCTGLLYD